MDKSALSKKAVKTESLIFRINNKCNSKTLSNINLFVSNKRTIANSPIIILNNLSLESINLIKSDYVLKRPKSYNLSVIVIGSPVTDIFEN